jgi:transposase-like protein
MEMITTRNELAQAYNLHANTMSKWLKELGIPSRKRLTSKEVRFIYEEFGEPEI